ncbi:MAG: hypothetical protein FWG61_00430 [Firmicutes bacterium]|nr:hypothetical protein [Bacillota bacterium]
MGKEKNKKNISQPNIILCEGDDTFYFIKGHLEYLQKNEAVFEKFQAFDFGGNKELPTFLSDDLPVKPGYDNITSIIIIRDSEDNFDSAVQEVKSALKKAGLPVPSEPNTIEQDDKIRVAFSLFPSLSNIKQNGTLEDLYIENLVEVGVNSVLDDIYAFLDDLKSKGRSFTWPHKTKLHTYFSVTNDYVTMKVGEATEAGAFDFECAKMNVLKELLKNIAMAKPIFPLAATSAADEAILKL